MKHGSNAYEVERIEAAIQKNLRRIKADKPRETQTWEAKILRLNARLAVLTAKPVVTA